MTAMSGSFSVRESSWLSLSLSLPVCLFVRLSIYLSLCLFLSLPLSPSLSLARSQRAHLVHGGHERVLLGAREQLTLLRKLQRDRVRRLRGVECEKGGARVLTVVFFLFLPCGGGGTETRQSGDARAAGSAPRASAQPRRTSASVGVSCSRVGVSERAPNLMIKVWCLGVSLSELGT